jgi:hydroxyacylglutathione hydrolase
MHYLRSMDSGWLSNAYLVWSEAGGEAVFVDSGAPLEPFHQAIEREGLRPRYLLLTHSHPDHVAGNDELVSCYGVTIETGAVEADGLRFDAIPTPGHSDDMVAFVVGGEAVFTGDTLFKDAVGGGDFEQVRASVMEVFMRMPHELRVLPGHTDETTIGREWEQNPFVKVWRGAETPLSEPCRVAGRDATLMVWSPDYDGKGKAWVRYEDGTDALVGGSRVERR